ncbi:V-set domain-containing T-cell activation inhibitor 1 [Merluccius polli]|uniref:V-set domain-containing T-cell activation inhibitor 1 n=1 Tax=Merluccius polli TaxID=89951 RepID=A0AA47N5N2_MERPO|nr:V-set domain-containing T-cell activation inhibitor 1 [Merluccius polli]
MAALGSALTQMVVLLMGVVTGQEATPVDCVFGGSCLLPCRFQPKSKTSLYWLKRNGMDVQVHSYYHDQDQLKQQDPLYRGRTSLFPDQISGGNASLHLARVVLQDQGMYKCYTGGNPTNVTVAVRAPVGTVDIMLVNDTVTCKSGGIYPRPELTWSISPRPATALQNTTEVHKDDQGLYVISGSLRTVYNDTESVYSCSVQNEHGAKTATMRQNPPMHSAPKSEVLLLCNASGLADITWTFNHNQTILRKRAGQEKPQVETEWQQHAGGLSESDSLLLNTTSAESAGTYTCTVSYAEETHVTNTKLKILEDRNEAPVGTVDIMLVNDTVTCKSGGIYPRPELTWSISPRLATALQNTTEVHEDYQGLYVISGSLRTVYNDTESVYSCSVQNEHGARTATMRQNPPMQSAPKSEVLLPCNASGLADITWTFNHNQTILRKRAGQEKPQVETEWQQHAGGLSESGSLLLNTTSAESAGTYTCTVSYAEETHVTNTKLKILEDRNEGRLLVKI